MAYRRSITARGQLFYQLRDRIAPSFSHIHRAENHLEESHTNATSRNDGIPNFFQQRCFFGRENGFGKLNGTKKMFQDHKFTISACCGFAFARNFSSGGVGEGAADNIEIMSDVADAFGDKAVELAAQVAPVVNEVAAVAADSIFPVAALQYLIGYVHMHTGFNWWASIALTTILIRGIQLPLMINQLISTSKLTLLRPRLEEIKEEMQNKDMSPDAVADGQARIKELLKEYGVTPFTPLKGLLISGPIFCSFFFAIRKLTENVPSFKEGGALWFTDLTTPDSLFILPVLTALTFWITVECNAQEGLEGNPTANTIKNVSRVFAVLTIPLTASFPKAIFCYWITSNLFSLAYGLVIKKPDVKKLLGVPIIPVVKPLIDQKPGFSLSEVVKKYAAASSSDRVSSQLPASPKNASPSVLSQRIKSLEKEVKGRKKDENR
ncbi:mitochondrial inner membrane protein OXA1-like isoform X1 [Primulina eburnea]|uniref:mitochondrial inner membrane protein OXA1-like isoform X1 n=1 Tax=Primulina eburnea TaxID=1245227 RepID=UPI003C6C5CE7